MGVSSKMSICLSSVCGLLSVCPSVTPNYFFNRWSDWNKNFSTKSGENEHVKILILKHRGQHPWVDSGTNSTLAHNFFEKEYFCKDKFTLQCVISAEF
jgi:hypothetical protein